ncbi:hypothetical protein SORBI_3001G095432 [Sorghum bicolor]|uniref:F-box domain-containing protein n=1 Tax=Sorghum bicolor TaxID=4558 RepID=A0A1Z5S4Z1_SORBI|nr:hypothetical protein SORBI_3001G095432 [Sorghum bicolor]
MDCPNLKRGAAAAVPVPCLAEDAILEILERAPVRSIHRFKCVSQRWCDLISDPVHRKRFPQALEGFFRTPQRRRWRLFPREIHQSAGDHRAPFQPFHLLPDEAARE